MTIAPATELLTAHATREGRLDYEGRAGDVAAGSEDASWAWPYSGADDAYIDAVGIDEICSKAGIDEDDWDSDVWCTAFQAAYESAHGPDPDPGVSLSPATDAYQAAVQAASVAADAWLESDDNNLALATEATDLAMDTARDAWLDSDESRKWSFRYDGTSHEAWARPSEIEDWVDEYVRSGYTEMDPAYGSIWAITYATPIDPVTGKSLIMHALRIEITIDPPVPKCAGRHCGPHSDHDWKSPIELVGGNRENPGVRGHGAGVMIRECCANCARYRTTDIWATDSETGRQGLHSVSYQDSDAESRAWAADPQTHGVAP